jgi:hypothetical protein
MATCRCVCFKLVLWLQVPGLLDIIPAIAGFGIIDSLDRASGGRGANRCNSDSKLIKSIPNVRNYEPCAPVLT